MATVVENRGEDQVGVGALPFQVRWSVPPGYKHLPRAAPALGYPIEVGAVANYDLPVTGAAQSPKTEWSVWPLVEYMPEDGLIFWVLRGDVAFDYEKIPSAGEWFDPSSYVFLGAEGASADAQPGEVSSTLTPFGTRDAMGSPWINASVWARMVPVATADGQVGKTPQYLVAYCFAGKVGAPLEDADEMLGSLSVVYD